MMFCSDLELIAVKPVWSRGGVHPCCPTPSGECVTMSNVSAQVSLFLSIKIWSDHKLHFFVRNHDSSHL